jgi:hypothetical protein
MSRKVIITVLRDEHGTIRCKEMKINKMSRKSDKNGGAVNSKVSTTNY